MDANGLTRTQRFFVPASPVRPRCALSSRCAVRGNMPMPGSLEERQAAVLRRLLRLEVAPACGAHRRQWPPDADGASELPWGAEQSSLGAAHERLRSSLEAAGVRCFRFVRVPSDYYDTPLDERRRALRAHHVDQLCKTIVVENATWAPLPGRPTGELEDVRNPRFFLVVVQYAARWNPDKIKAWFVEANAGELAKTRIKPRLASAEDSERLTGYKHGGVTPVAVVTPELPILLSHRVAQLQPAIFYLGAQDLDLKVCLRLHDFMQRFRPAVVEMTDD